MHFSDILIRLIAFILSDMLQPVSYIPTGIACGVFALICAFAVPRFRRFSHERPERWIAFFLCIVYFSVTLQMAFFSREPGSRKSIDLVLFSTWGNTARAHAYVIENIIMFIPFGVLTPALLRPLRHAPLCVLCGFSFSVLLELMQLVTERGHCQIDDVVTNTLGTLIGWALFSLIYRRRHTHPE